MFEKLKIEVGESAREEQINLLISILAALFCYLFTKLFLSYGYLSVASITSLGISTYGIIAFYHVLSFYELQERESPIKWLMYIGIFSLFLIIISQLMEFSELVDKKVPSLIVGVALVLVPRLGWSTIKQMFERKKAPLLFLPLTNLTLPLTNLTELTNVLTKAYSLIKKINLLPRVMVVLTQFAARLGLTSTQSNLFVSLIFAGSFYLLINFLEMVVRWILLLLILGLAISMMVGVF